MVCLGCLLFTSHVQCLVFCPIIISPISYCSIDIWCMALGYLIHLSSRVRYFVCLLFLGAFVVFLVIATTNKKMCLPLMRGTIDVMIPLW